MWSQMASKLMTDDTDEYLNTVENMLRDESFGCHSERRCTSDPKDLCMNDLRMLFATIPLQNMLKASKTFKKHNTFYANPQITINNLKRPIACIIFSELQISYAEDKLDVTQFSRNPNTFLRGDRVICPPAVSGIVLGGEEGARKHISTLRVAVPDKKGGTKQIFVDTRTTFHNFKIAGKTAHKNPCRQAAGENCWSASQLKKIAQQVKKTYPKKVVRPVGTTKSENIELIQCFIGSKKAREQIVNEIARDIS